MLISYGFARVSDLIRRSSFLKDLSPEQLRDHNGFVDKSRALLVPFVEELQSKQYGAELALLESRPWARYGQGSASFDREAVFSLKTPRVGLGLLGLKRTEMAISVRADAWHKPHMIHVALQVPGTKFTPGFYLPCEGEYYLFGKCGKFARRTVYRFEYGTWDRPLPPDQTKDQLRIGLGKLIAA